MRRGGNGATASFVVSRWRTDLQSSRTVGEPSTHPAIRLRIFPVHDFLSHWAPFARLPATPQPSPETHDYKRNGTTTLFAALNVLDGTVIGRNMKRHRHQEFIRFLNDIEAQVPKRKKIHVIVDNYATHKHPKVRDWLARHPRWTSASWLNAIEGFAKLTNRRLSRGVFRSVAELKAAIERFVAETNADPKPFVWTARPSRILAAVKRGKQALESLH